MLRLCSFFTALILSLSLSLSACKKHSEPVKTEGGESTSANVEGKKAASPEEPLFKIAEQSRKTLDDAKKLEEEMKKAAEAQKKALDAQEKAIEEAK
ncbi:hypothetical protein H8K35_15315 [Undibacterium sp. LX40W]|uniref:Lipoprotein n=1 Tax=Undibacterium nitidum TaxID=2762298 RepID=A0A923HNF4_9BURK|nr:MULTISPECIES: hypothetical protein [Undibacterium]MBC3882775.1 hypothetical protein [Undibacterium nitidum]MBC3893042.1 hypothetical protein [Undibacterium sp. LX40W]